MDHTFVMNDDNEVIVEDLEFVVDGDGSVVEYAEECEEDKGHNSDQPLEESIH